MLRYLMAYPKKNFSYPGPSMWFSNQINWIISNVQAKKFFLIIFLASNKVLAMLGSWIGTCSVFFSFIFSLTWGECAWWHYWRGQKTLGQHRLGQGPRLKCPHWTEFPWDVVLSLRNCKETWAEKENSNFV